MRPNRRFFCKKRLIRITEPCALLSPVIGSRSFR
jgi:hypothetical protein